MKEEIIKLFKLKLCGLMESVKELEAYLEYERQKLNEKMEWNATKEKAGKSLTAVEISDLENSKEIMKKMQEEICGCLESQRKVIKIIAYLEENLK